jgi:hypothetical protein
MSLKYYPLTRVIPNKYTRGDEYVLPDGTSYVGRYYITYDNSVFTGINPVLGTNIPLTEIKATQFETRHTPALNSLAAINYTAASSQPSPYDDNFELTELIPYYPVVLDSDYARGYFTRYFAKSVSGPGYIIEISKLDWTKISDGNVSPGVLGYQITDMLWQLTGPLKDTRVSQYQIKGGVFDTNKRVTENKAKGFNGLIAFIGGEYTKYAIITPDVATTGSI